MNTSPRLLSITTLLVSFALVACNKGAPETTAPQAAPPTTSPAVDARMSAPTTPLTVTTVDLGNAVGAEKRVEVPMTVFGRNDTIYASVSTQSADAAPPTRSRLTARWTYQDGQVVDELSQDYSFTGTGNTVFQISNQDGWPVGSYKVEILLDDALVQTRQFDVR